jgi:hypothetical protein
MHNNFTWNPMNTYQVWCYCITDWMVYKRTSCTNQMLYNWLLQYAQILKNTAIVHFIIGSKNVCLFYISVNNHEMALCLQHFITSGYCSVHGLANQCVPWDSRGAATYFNDKGKTLLHPESCGHTALYYALIIGSLFLRMLLCFPFD